MKTDELPVDGADLHVEVRGNGPVLLMIPGGGGDAGYYEPIASRLTAGYTVVSYDRRGNSRSPLRGDPTLRMEQQSSDALAVLRVAGAATGSVFGNSGGAIIALDMAARYPDAVDAVIAHEPPIIGVLPDVDDLAAAFEEVVSTNEADGWEAALIKFAAPTRISRASAAALPDPAPDTLAALTALTTRLAKNWAFFFEHEMRAFARYEPDLDGLRGNGVPLLFAGGHESRTFTACRAAEALAELVGAPFAEFPGGHGGYLEDPDGFAAVLDRVVRTLRAAAGRPT